MLLFYVKLKNFNFQDHFQIFFDFSKASASLSGQKLALEQNSADATGIRGQNYHVLVIFAFFLAMNLNF